MNIIIPKECDDEIRLKEMLHKLELNKQHVALDILKTKYQVNYEKLLREIKELALQIIKPKASKLPDWMTDQIKTEHIEELGAIFNQIYETGCYSNKIGTALYSHYSVEETLAIAAEINNQFQAELARIFKQKGGSS